MMGAKLLLVQIKIFVFECATYSLYVLNKGWKHYSRQMIKFLYVRSTCRQAVLNKGLKHELHQLKEFVYIR